MPRGRQRSSESVPRVCGSRGGALNPLAQVFGFLKGRAKVGLLFSERSHPDLDLSALAHRHQAHLGKTNGQINLLVFLDFMTYRTNCCYAKIPATAAISYQIILYCCSSIKRSPHEGK